MVFHHYTRQKATFHLVAEQFQMDTNTGICKISKGRFRYLSYILLQVFFHFFCQNLLWGNDEFVFFVMCWSNIGTNTDTGYRYFIELFFLLLSIGGGGISLMTAAVIVIYLF